ncbi:MAG: hypothetical protein RIR97_403 [Pseudomonadota bacterium]
MQRRQIQDASNGVLSGQSSEALTADDLLSGENLMACVRRIGLGYESQIEKIPLSALEQSQMPCVAVLKSGNGVIIRRFAGRMADIEANGQTAKIRIDSLLQVYSGSAIVSSATEVESADTLVQDVTFHPSLRNIFFHTMRSRHILTVIALACVSNLLMFILPLYSMAVYDRIIPHKAYETLWALTIGIMIVLVIDFAARVLRNQVQEEIAQTVSAELQQRIFGKILSTDIENAPKTTSAITSAMSAVDSACNLAPTILVGLFIDIPFVVLLLIYVAFVGHWVVVVPLLSFVAIVVSNYILHVMARKAHAASAGDHIARTILLEESVGAFSVTKLTSAKDHTYRHMKKLLATSIFSSAAARANTNMTAQISSAIIQINTVLSLVIGVLMISQGAMTVGALVSAVMLSGRGISPLIALSGSLVRAASLKEPLQIAAGFVELPSEEAGDSQRTLTGLRGDVALSGVTFRYAQSSAPTLKDLSLSIAAGEKVGIIGRIGCGKSTFVKMLPRLHLPETGGILIDGHDVRQYDPETLRRHISYMPQDCDLFDTTIRDNIVKGLTSVDENLFDMAVTVSGVKDIIAGHPAGYDLKVGKFGRRLSGGERQAVCMARALVRPASILVFDEPTSSMDGQMERSVIERLRVAIGSKTFIAATHRTPLLSLVDRVIWLENGKVIADGPTKDVISHAARLT